MQPIRARWSPAFVPVVWASLWALLGAAACTAMIPLEPSLLEEGMMLHVAQRLVAGERLFRDIASYTGPLPFELLAGLFRLFGQEIAVGRIAVVVLHASACASVYGLARRAGAGPLAHAAAACLAAAPVLLFPLYSIYFYATLALHLSLIAAWAALLGTRSVAWAALAGVLVACVALCKQTLGLLLAPALLAALVAGSAPRRRAHQGLSMLLGAACVALLVLTLYGVRRDLGVLVHSLVVMPLSLGETFKMPSVNFWPPGELAPEVRALQSFYVPHLYNILARQIRELGTPVILATQLLYALPFVALAATALRRVAGPLTAATWAHTAALVALMANLFPRPDWGHLVFALPPAAAQLCLLWSGAAAGAAGRRARRVFAAALVLALAVGASVAGRQLHAMAGPASFGPRVPQLPVSKFTKNPGVPRAIRFLMRRVHPGEAIFVARSEPLIYFATDTYNPTPYSGVIPVLREEQEKSIITALQHVRYVVMSEIDQPQFLYYADELPSVQAYLERHFRVPREYTQGWSSWLLVFERGPDRGATALDLVDAGGAAEAWIRDEEGVRRPAPAAPPRLASRHNRRPLPILLGARGGGIDFELEVPGGAFFQADVGLRRVLGPERMHEHPERTRLTVSVGGGEGFETLASIAVLQRRGEGGRWTPFEVDLSAYAERRLTLRLEVSSDRPFDPGALSWWGSPRIALRP
jgi:hypothetical protein